MKTSVEFYLGGNQRPFCVVDAQFQPQRDDLVNIRGITYRVVGRSFTVDNAESFSERSMRCNVIVEVHE